MRVVCDSCGATYKIPDTKLVKDVNRATCRKCGHRMLIKKPDAPALGTYPSAATEEERHDPERSGAPGHELPDRLLETRRKVVEIGQFNGKIGRRGAKTLGDGPEGLSPSRVTRTMGKEDNRGRRRVGLRRARHDVRL